MSESTEKPAVTDNKLARFEPQPQVKKAQTQQKTEQAVAKVHAPAADKKQAKVAKPKTNSVPRPRAAKKTSDESQFLDLGAGYKIAHKPGSAYSVFYKVVAERGHFATIAKELEDNVYDVNNKDDANKLLSKLFVPVENLSKWCRANSTWQEHADKKTELLSKKAKHGDKQAKELLKNNNRCADGEWSGNIPEIISTCVGYYNWLVEKKRGKPNKNVKKFQDAGIVVRRFPLAKSSQPSFVLMFPEKYIDTIRTAIVVGRGVIESDGKK